MRKIGKTAIYERTWSLVFVGATAVAIIFLVTLILNIINGAFGYVLIKNEIEPSSLMKDGISLESAEAPRLIELLNEHMSEGLVRRYNFEKPLESRTQEELLDIVVERIVDPHVVKTWTLLESVFLKKSIAAEAGKTPEMLLSFRSWVNPGFLTKPQSSTPEDAGIRTALLGSLWTIFITIIFAFPIGVGAAVYLEEYAPDTRFNRIIQVNIYNLAGVPSIIYGILGLAIFVRAMEPLTSGTLFGLGDPTTANGRTVFSAGLTLALLILPVIIITSQEAIRAVPQNLRESSYAIGATKWQTIWHHVLPSCFDRILTGTILSISRAIGETAPLVVIGASTFIAIDPTSPFSKFTTLPAQIYQWTARPQHAFRNISAAAIVVLMILLLSLNSFAIIVRNKVSEQRRLM